MGILENLRYAILQHLIWQNKWVQKRKSKCPTEMTVTSAFYSSSQSYSRMSAMQEITTEVEIISCYHFTNANVCI
jgi:hypothetical protein